jgi:hypothetical protein
MIKMSDLLPVRKPVIVAPAPIPVVEIIVPMDPKGVDPGIQADSEDDQLTEKMFPQEFDRHAPGSCMVAAEMATKYLLSRGYKGFKIVEGWVSLHPDQEEDEWGAHTWIEFQNGRKFDPTKKQFSKWGFDPNEVDYMEKVNRTFTPDEYLDVCQWDGSDWQKFKKNNEIKEISYSKMMKQVLNERMSFKQLLSVTDPVRISKSRTDVTAKSIRVESMDGQEAWTFNYKSSPSTTGQRWHGYVKFLKGDVDETDRADDLDCMVDCDCPDYRYRFAYNNAHAGAGALGANAWNDNNGQAPRPRSQGGVGNLGEGLCKHLSSLGRFLKTYIDPVSPEHNPKKMPVAEPPVKPAAVVKPSIPSKITAKPTVAAPKPSVVQKPTEPVAKIVKPVKKVINPPKTSSDAPDPEDDTYTDSREDGYSDSRSDLNESAGEVIGKISQLIQSQPSFDIFYED